MLVISQPFASAAQSYAAGAGAGINPFNVIAGEPGAGAQNNLNAPGSNRLAGQPFRVRAAGYVSVAAGTVTTGTAPLSIVIYGSNTANFAAASGNALFTVAVAGTQTIANAAAVLLPFEVELKLVGSAGGSVVGTGEGMSSSPNAATTSVSTSRTAIGQAIGSFVPANEPPAQFAVAVLVGASSNLPAMTAVLTQFQLEA